MFSAKTYTARRETLRTKIGSGIILLPGNPLSANNYPNNAYYFRQDSTFRYYFGLNVPALVGVIDADSGEEALYGDDFTVEADAASTTSRPTAGRRNSSSRSCSEYAPRCCTTTSR